MIKGGFFGLGAHVPVLILCNILFILSVLSLFFDHFHIFLISRITSFLFILFELFHLIIRDKDADENLLTEAGKYIEIRRLTIEDVVN